MTFGLSGPHKKKLKHGDVTIFNMGKARLHTYVAPENSFGDATHIIETPNFLSIVDTQYMKPYTQEFRNYVNSLNKTIAGVIVSHSHPDHYFGLWAFDDVATYALPEVIEDIKNKGPAMIKESNKNLKDMIPDHITVPKNSLYLGEITVDGLLFRYKKYDNVESDTQLVIELPEIKTVIVQDMLYNRYHPWVDKHVQNWKQTLPIVQKEYKDDHMILVGHGPPTSPGSYNRMLKYLTDLETILEQAKQEDGTLDKKSIETLLIEKYPKYKGKNIIPMWMEYYK